ncbi:hypothetical protein D3C73_1636330 [compost metagenome]
MAAGKLGKLKRRPQNGGGSEGHINPTLGVVEELVRRGELMLEFCHGAKRL